MHNNQTSSGNTQRSSTPWYQSILLTVFLLIIAILNFMASFTYMVSEMETKPSMLILKHDSCDLLSQYGLSIQERADNTCQVKAKFRANNFNRGGIVIADDQQISIQDNQVIVVTALENAPSIQELRLSKIWLYISAAIFVWIAAWLIYIGRPKGRESLSN
jgi:hypothetical protein